MSGAITAGTIATVAGIGAAGSIGSALIGSNAASNAASAQENAANNAAQLQYQASQNALDFQKQQYNQSQQNEAPWLQSGTGALSNLNNLLGISPMTSQQFGTSGSGLGMTQPLGGAFGASNPSSPAPVGGPQMPTVTRQSQPNISANGPGTTSPISGGIAANGTPAAMTGSVSANGVPVSLSGGIAANGSPAGMTGLAPGAASGIARPGAVVGQPVRNDVSGSSGAQPIMPAAGAPSSSAPGGFGSLMQGYGQTFQAPTGLTEQNDPGYQARLQLGQTALQKSAAARGNLLTGGTAQALNQTAQDYASNEYSNVYNRALTGYDTNYNVWNNDQTNQFNRLASIAGVGQTAANQLSNAGQNASNNVSSNLLGTAGAIGQDYQNAAAANASGIVGGANAWSGALGNTGSSLSNLLLLQQLQGGAGANYGGGSSSYGELG